MSVVIFRLVRVLLDMAWVLLQRLARWLFRIEIKTLFVDHGLKELLCWLEVVPRPVEEFVRSGFLFWTVEAIEIRVGFVKE